MSKFVPVETFDAENVNQIEATDKVLNTFVNSYYQKFLNNDYALKKKSERQDRLVKVSLNSSNWQGSSVPYTQTLTVDVDGNALPFTTTDKPLLCSDLEDNASASAQKAYSKAYGIVASGNASVATGSVTFKVWKLPVTTIVVGLRGC